MTPEERKEKNAVMNTAKEMRNTKSGKELREKFMTSILSFSKNLPNWGGLSVKVTS